MLDTAVATLLPTPVLAVLLGLAGLVAGPFLAHVASRRTLAQPLALALEDETTLLTGVVGDVRRLPYLTSLAPADFASGAHSRIWSALLTCAPECHDVPDDASEEECEARGQQLLARREQYLAAVTSVLRQGPAPHGDIERFVELSEASEDNPLDDAKVVEAGQAVLFAGTDRNRLAGAGLVLPTATPDSADPASPPLHRVHVRPSRLRQALTAVATGVTAAVTPGLVAAAGFTGAAAGAAIGSVLALLVLSIVVSLVDLDTFYIDLRVFTVTGLLSWSLAVAAAGLDGSWGRLTSGVVIVAGVAVVFELGNKLYKLARGTDGQGFGDTLIILATAGVPPALAGMWELGYYAVMAGMLVGVLGWALGAVRGKLGRTTPFAFGPYLAAGWVVAWVVVVALGSPGL